MSVQALPQFADLGEVVQDLLRSIESHGHTVDTSTLGTLQTLTVKTLAKVYDMMAASEDPETILSWLMRRRRGREGRKPTAWEAERKAILQEQNERNPREHFQRLEASNAARFAKIEADDAARTEARNTKAAARSATRTSQQTPGTEYHASSSPQSDAVRRIFDAFSSESSALESDLQSDSWWKAEPIRRNWETNGSSWKAVLPGSAQIASKTMIEERQAFYESEWWKADEYKRNWQATKELQWWKASQYAEDWRHNRGAWCAHAVSHDNSGNLSMELAEREEWYQANTEGVEMKWCRALQDSDSTDTCSKEERLIREEFYRANDWWKSAEAISDYRTHGAASATLQNTHPTDLQWWQHPDCIQDHLDHGKNGKKWTALTKESDGNIILLPEAELKHRQKWYKKNFWKAPCMVSNWESQGTAWKGKTKKEGAKEVSSAEVEHRESWYQRGEVWKAPECVEDFHANGDAWRDGVGEEEAAKRAVWYRENWWRSPKYLNDYVQNSQLSDREKTAWGRPCPHSSPAEREAWYHTQIPNDDMAVREAWLREAMKQPAILLEELPALLAAINENVPATEAELADVTQRLHLNGGDTVDREDLVGAVCSWFYVAPDKEELRLASKEALQKEETQQLLAEEEEAAYLMMEWERSAEYEEPQVSQWQTLKRRGEDWWKAPKYVEDFMSHEGDENAEWARLNEGAERSAGEEQISQRAEWMRENFWRAPAYSREWVIGNSSWMKTHSADDEATPDALQKREEWYREGQALDGEVKEELRLTKEAQTETQQPEEEEAAYLMEWERLAEEKKRPQVLRWQTLRRNGEDWWKAPKHIEDFMSHEGDENAEWARLNEGAERSAGEEEISQRAEWMRENFWRAPAYSREWVIGNSSWMKTHSADDEATPDALQKREEWYREGQALDGEVKANGHALPDDESNASEPDCDGSSYDDDTPEDCSAYGHSDWGDQEILYSGDSSTDTTEVEEQSTDSEDGAPDEDTYNVASEPEDDATSLKHGGDGSRCWCGCDDDSTLDYDEVETDHDEASIECSEGSTAETEQLSELECCDNHDWDRIWFDVTQSGEEEDSDGDSDSSSTTDNPHKDDAPFCLYIKGAPLCEHELEWDVDSTDSEEEEG